MLYLRLQALNLCLQHGFLACQGLHPLDPWGLHPNTHYIVNPSTHYIVNPSTHYIVNPSTHYIFNSSTHHIVNPNIFYVYIYFCLKHFSLFPHFPVNIPVGTRNIPMSQHKVDMDRTRWLTIWIYYVLMTSYAVGKSLCIPLLQRVAYTMANKQWICIGNCVVCWHALLYLA